MSGEDDSYELFLVGGVHVTIEKLIEDDEVKFFATFVPSPDAVFSRFHEADLRDLERAVSAARTTIRFLRDDVTILEAAQALKDAGVLETAPTGREDS